MPVNLEIIPAGAALGAEVRGLDLSQPVDNRKADRYPTRGRELAQ
jgi:hypothetical protein